MKISKFVRTILPDFCWQTRHEILTMMEYADENFMNDLTEGNLGVSLRYYIGIGVVETKKAAYDTWRRDGMKSRLYKRRCFYEKTVA